MKETRVIFISQSQENKLIEICIYNDIEYNYWSYMGNLIIEEMTQQN